jgi:hypothetical protein
MALIGFQKQEVFNWINNTYDKSLEGLEDMTEMEFINSVLNKTKNDIIFIWSVIAADQLLLNREDVIPIATEFFKEKYAFVQKQEREKRIDAIKELYKDIHPEEIDKLATLFPMYGGTLISNLVLDLYDSLVYGETPKGPNQ